jgi:hypothetical protein
VRLVARALRKERAEAVTFWFSEKDEGKFHHPAVEGSPHCHPVFERWFAESDDDDDDEKVKFEAIAR